MIVIFFISAFLLVLFGSNYFIYYSLVNFFNILNPHARTTLLFCVLFPPIAFIALSILLNYYDFYFLKKLYIIDSVILGMVVSFLVFIVSGWIIICLFKIAGIELNRRILGSVLVFLALAWSAYGIWNADNLTTKHITVPIKNLPESWKNKTAVQISDTHLGVIHGKPFMQNIVDKINAVNPDIIFITGDLFDGMGDDLKDSVKPLGELNPPDGAYFITGNHETYLGIDKAREALKNTRIKFMRDEIINIGGMQIVGINYPLRGFSKDIAPILKNINPGLPGILLYHEPVNIELARKAGVNLQLSGHTHAGQLFPIGYISNLIYKGFGYGLHTIGNYSIYTTSGAGTWGPPMRTGNRPEIVEISFE